MKARLHILAAVLLLFVPMTLSAQNHVRRAMERARERQEAMARMKVDSEKGKGGGSGNMRVLVENGDTTFLDRVPAVYIVGRGRRSGEKSWKDYYRLVWRFARVYPYAQASGKLVKQVDSTLNAEHYGFIRKERYISAIQKQLFKDFEGSFREMSIQQGAMLLKLIDRETGITSYELIKNYKSGFAAGFWQGGQAFRQRPQIPVRPHRGRSRTGRTGANLAARRIPQPVLVRLLGRPPDGGDSGNLFIVPHGGLVPLRRRVRNRRSKTAVSFFQQRM